MTDCCGKTGNIDTHTCPDCGHVCCDSCSCSIGRHWCNCRYGTRGHAHTDETSVEGRQFTARISGYRGPFKPVLQVQMEADMTRLSRPRVDKCGYAYCGADTRGVQDPLNDTRVRAQAKANRTKLTDDNIDQFVICQRCRSVAYCSEQCRALDRVHRRWNSWDGVIGTHADQCDGDGEYLDNATLPYVSVKVRNYREEFGYYPNPFGKKEEEDGKK